MAEKKINKSRRNFLFGAVRRLKHEDTEQPMAATSESASVMKEANAFYVDGDWEEARTRYKQCLESEKNDVDIRYRLGVCLYRLGQYRQAKLEFERALLINKSYRDALLYLGLTQVRMGKPEKALDHWKEYFNPMAITVQRELNLQIGLMQTGQSDPDETIAEAVEKAIEQAGDAVG